METATPILRTQLRPSTFAVTVHPGGIGTEYTTYHDTREEAIRIAEECATNMRLPEANRAPTGMVAWVTIREETLTIYY